MYACMYKHHPCNLEHHCKHKPVAECLVGWRAALKYLCKFSIDKERQGEQDTTDYYKIANNTDSVQLVTVHMLEEQATSKTITQSNTEQHIAGQQAILPTLVQKCFYRVLFLPILRTSANTCTFDQKKGSHTIGISSMYKQKIAFFAKSIVCPGCSLQTPPNCTHPIHKKQFLIAESPVTSSVWQTDNLLTTLKPSRNHMYTFSGGTVYTCVVWYCVHVCAT